MKNIKIRNIKKEDIPKVVDIQIDAWRTAYKEIIDSQYLKEMNKEDKIKQREKDYKQDRFIVAEMNNEVVGFCRYIANNSETPEVPEADCEILALYVKSNLKQNGIGKTMFEYAKNEFIKQQKTKMVLWCLNDNEPSKRFYEKMGGKIIKERLFTIGEKDYAVVCFCYDI